MSIEIKKKVGRKKGQVAVKDKFLVQFHNIKLGKWEDLGTYPSLKIASEKLNLSYGMISDININRRKIYNNFYRVINLKKVAEVPN